ncbi:MAG: hypothetical protein Q7S40_19070 [Opitutaceae bacterium]|nr:hypothetical protein [Opitutaceae bacterium]
MKIVVVGLGCVSLPLAGKFHPLLRCERTEWSLVPCAVARATISRLRAKPLCGFAFSPHELGALAEALGHLWSDTGENQFECEKCGLALQFRRSGVAVTGLDMDAAKVATLPRRESYLRHFPASAGAEQIATGGVCGLEFA